MNKKIAIIGGYGGTGGFFARFFARKGFDVVVTGPSEAKGKAFAQEAGVKYLKENREAASSADVVIISVPVDDTVAVIKEVAPQVRAGSLLMDFTSVKEEPCKAMLEHAREGVEIVGTHPMFSHRVSGIEGQVVILTPVRGEKGFAWLKKLLSEEKARVYETTPEEHDKMMAVVQGLTHFAYISIGKTLEELDFDIKESRNFSSPIYELMLDMIGRIIGQNPDLYASIQMNNPHTHKVHERFEKTSKKLGEMVSKKDRQGFRNFMVSAARHFGDVERAMGRSDKAISALVYEISQLAGSLGKEICLRHIYSGQIHYGIVKSVDPDEVVIEDSGKESRLKVSNIQILGEKETLEYLEKKQGLVERDFSVVLGMDVDGEFIADLLKKFDENIISAEIKDEYSGPQIGKDKKSICFRVEMINSEVKKTEGGIKRFFASIGGALR